jgi:hypothetical protein
MRGASRDEFNPTTAAFLLFGPQPASRFPQSEILAEAYHEDRISGRPKGQSTINAPLARALEQVLKFVDDHTFHPRRVVGLNNVRLDEYPVAALREALVNAVAHRSYDDRSRKVIVRIFRDRIEAAQICMQQSLRAEKSAWGRSGSHKWRRYGSNCLMTRFDPNASSTPMRRRSLRVDFWK